MARKMECLPASVSLGGSDEVRRSMNVPGMGAFKSKRGGRLPGGLLDHVSRGSSFPFDFTV